MINQEHSLRKYDFVKKRRRKGRLNCFSESVFNFFGSQKKSKQDEYDKGMKEVTTCVHKSLVCKCCIPFSRYGIMTSLGLLKFPFLIKPI